MSRLTVTLIFAFAISVANAQKTSFAYIQTENSQPFYVRINDKVMSSSSSGHLILPGLKDSTYLVRAGFPQNKWPEQLFRVEISGKDRGLILKNLGEKGWALFDLQTLTLQMADTTTADGRIMRIEPKKVSAFTEVLSKAVNDPSLKETVVYVQKEQKTEPVQAVVKEEVKVTPETVSTPKKDSVAVRAVIAKNTMEVQKTDTASSIVKTPEVIAKKEVNKEEVAGKEEVKQVTAPAADSLPARKLEVESLKSGELEKENQPAKQPEEVKATVTEKANGKEEVKEEVKEVKVADPVLATSVVRRRSESSTSDGFGITYVDEFSDGKKDTIRILIPAEKQVVKAGPHDKKFLDIPVAASDSVQVTAVLPVNDCKMVASEGDFQKLKKKMGALTADDAMIDEAKKVYASRCVTVKQVRALGDLFKNDAARFQFFEASYRKVTDISNFATLEKELRNEYYVKRFRAIGK